jgi:hypothetical protein
VNGVWTAQPGESSGNVRVPESTTPPAAAAEGNLWFNDSEGRLYIYYQDADSSQWIDASPDSNAPSSVPDILDPNFQDNTTDIRYLMLSGVNSPITGDISIGSANQIQLNVDGSADFQGTVTSPFFNGIASGIDRSVSASNGLEGGGSLTSDVVIIGVNASTSAKGVVQLDNTITNTSTSLAATANAARLAYNRAAEYAPSKTGTNATGNWGINITGVASLVTSTVSTATGFRPFAFYATGGTPGQQSLLTTVNTDSVGIRPSTGEIKASQFTGTLETALIQGDTNNVISFKPNRSTEIFRVQNGTSVGETCIRQSGSGQVEFEGVYDNTTVDRGPNVHVRPDGRLLRVTSSSVDSIENLKALITALEARVAALEA